MYKIHPKITKHPPTSVCFDIFLHFQAFFMWNLSKWSSKTPNKAILKNHVENVAHKRREKIQVVSPVFPPLRFWMFLGMGSSKTPKILFVFLIWRGGSNQKENENTVKKEQA
jgi:hypothetical protein